MSGKRRMYSPEEYLRVRKRNYMILGVAGVACVIATYVSMVANDNHMSLADITTTIINHLNGVPFEDTRQEFEDFFVFGFYIPRAIGCVTIGAILSVGGAIMQTIIRNPLADPFTTGISSGALLGVSLSIVFGIGLGLSYSLNLMAMAFLFSMLPCGIIIIFTFFKQATSGVIVLIGIAVSYVFSACSTLVMYSADTMDYEKIYHWSLGSLANIRPDSWMVLTASAIAMIAILMYMSKRINIASVDDKLATSLGVNSPRTRIICLLIVSAFTAISVSYAGTIGFVGLIIPNIARKIVASDSKILIPFSAILGGVFLLVCDIIARSVILGGISVGIITAFIGGPMMLFILLKMKKNAWSN
ncbi:MAG: iron ABC transporter permease [Candidatus Methanomethylophilaceae archaeon]|nr:iron ABC transporter permease [Candidatus Methanomethylophilaceae archaeon]